MSRGNQLPYIDKITHRLFENAEVKNLWVTNGEIDMQYRHMAHRRPGALQERRGQGRLQDGPGHQRRPCRDAAQPEHQEQAAERVLQQPQGAPGDLARRSTATRSTSWSTTACCKPRQYSPLTMSPQYYEKAATAWIKFDPDTANKLLDEAGYSKKGADGIRLHKDGTTPISFIIEGTDQTGTPTEDAVLLVSKDLAKVGIKGTYKYSERALYTQHYEANDIEAAWWGGDRTVLPIGARGDHLPRRPARPAVVPRLGVLLQRPEGPQRGAAARRPLDLHHLEDLGRGSRGAAGSREADRGVQEDPGHLGRAVADDRRPGRAALAHHRQERLQGLLPGHAD